MRRLSLSTKLFVALLPLILALAGMLAISVVDGVRDVDRARPGAQAIVTAIAVVAAIAIASLVARSITRRVRTVSIAAERMSTERLPVLVDALRDPQGHLTLPDAVEIDDRGSDEFAELASSFNALQRTLGDVAAEQIEVLQRGVSDIFITVARRNRSLVDRQLTLLDELDDGVGDPAVLAGYDRLERLATRMRRNTESLLVLANTDMTRRRSRPASIDQVVRAAIRQVDDHQRIDVANLEYLNVRGSVVADIDHLLAELLDNATAYSTTASRVHLSGDLIDGNYHLLVIDRGIGMNEQRLVELNELLANPPVTGLSMQPTLGMTVVSLLAAKHGIKVTLAQSTPGLIVKIVLPSEVFERRAAERSAPSVAPPAHHDPDPGQEPTPAEGTRSRTEHRTSRFRTRRRQRAAARAATAERPSSVAGDSDAGSTPVLGAAGGPPDGAVLPPPSCDR